MSLSLRGPARARALALLSLAALSGGCAGADPDGGSGGGAPIAAWQGGAPDEAIDEPLGAPAPPPVRRGLGTITARVPGTTQTIGGVGLAAHEVVVSVRDGFARTEIREELHNDTDRVLEGRYTFPLPPGASVARLGLWVGRELVEGELVERGAASRIFRGIVEDTVRPRDPALLEWAGASELSLTIFPIPPHGSRRVLLAYDEALPRAGERAAYVLPLSLGDDAAPAIGAVSVEIALEEGGAGPRDVETPGYPSARVDVGEAATRVRFDARGFVPKGDLVVSYARAPRAGAIEAATGTIAAPAPARGGGQTPEPTAEREGFVAVRVVAEPAESAASAARVPIERAIVLDVSQSQSAETLAAEGRLALALVRALRAEDEAVLLACDSACETYPHDGPIARGAVSMRALAGWLGALGPRGSSDLAGAVLDAARRLRAGERRTQVVVLGDGSPSSGELSAASIAARVKPALEARRAELALVGVGPSLDEVVLGGLARALGGSYERLAGAASLDARAAAIAAGLEQPVVADARLELPAGLSDPEPRALPSVRLGQEVVVYARRTGALEGATAALTGRVGDRPYRREGALGLANGARDVAAVPRLWAEARLSELAEGESREAAAESIALSKRFRVMARGTAWLVLESDRMFAELGIPRTARPRGDDDDRLGLVGPRAAPGALGASMTAGEARAPLALGSLSALSASPPALDAQSPHASASALSAPSADAVPKAQGFGSGHGRIGGAHRTRAPMIRMAVCTVTGRLPPESVRRIVRLNFGRFRACYERGLARNPDLAGRVTARFVIARDGGVSAVADGGSDLPDPEVVACVLRSYHSLAFPEPEGGIVTVTYPIVFASDGTRPLAPATLWPDAPPRPPSPAPPAPPVWSGPSAVIAPSADAWTKAGDGAIAKLAGALDAAPLVRARHEALVRGLLVRGRFEGALAAARRFVELDPDLPLARELLASAFAATGDGASAARALDELVEAAPRGAAGHARAARAFEATGDERRACAHWRALAELRKDAREGEWDEAMAESLRCRARAWGERDEVLAAARAASGRSTPRITSLASALEGGLAPAYAPDGPPGTLEASVSCGADRTSCPVVIVIAPDGAVLSPWTPSSRARSGAGSVAMPGVVDGVYRVLVVGGGAGAKGELTVRALGAKRTFAIEGGGQRSVAMVTVMGTG